MMIFKTEICRCLLSSINLIWCCQEINRSTAQMYVWPCPTSVLINIQLVWMWSVECSGIQLPGVEWNSLFYAPICLLFTRLTPHFNISCKISTHFGEENSDVIFSQSLRSFDFFLKVHLVDREEINLTTDHRDLHRVRNVDQDVLGGHNAHYWSILHPKWRWKQPTTLVNYLIDQQLTFPLDKYKTGGEGGGGVWSCPVVSCQCPVDTSQSLHWPL